MPPSTSSTEMGDSQQDGVEPVESTSHNVAGDELSSLMSKIMADLRDLKEGQTTMHVTQDAMFEDLKEFKVSIHANKNFLHDELNALKTMRSNTSRSNSTHHHVSDGRYRRNENSLRSERRISCDKWGRVEQELEHQERPHQDYRCYGGYSREMHGRGDYGSRGHDDVFERVVRRERVSRLHEEPPRRSKNREYRRIPGLERPIEGEVPCRARMDPFDRHGGGGMNQTFTSSCCKGTSSSFHTPKVPLGLCPDVSSSMTSIQSGRRKNREREREREKA